MARVYSPRLCATARAAFNADIPINARPTSDGVVMSIIKACKEGPTTVPRTPSRAAGGTCHVSAKRVLVYA